MIVLMTVSVLLSLIACALVVYGMSGHRMMTTWLERYGIYLFWVDVDRMYFLLYRDSPAERWLMSTWFYKRGFGRCMVARVGNDTRNWSEFSI